jgi:hypothetical protein
LSSFYFNLGIDASEKYSMIELKLKRARFDDNRDRINVVH